MAAKPQPLIEPTSVSQRSSNSQAPATIIANEPAPTVAQALANSKAQVDATAKR